MGAPCRYIGFSFATEFSDSWLIILLSKYRNTVYNCHALCLRCAGDNTLALTALFKGQDLTLILVNFFFFALQDSVAPQSLDMVGVKIPTVRIHMREVFNSPADELYSIFTKKEVSDGFRRHFN